MTMVQCPTSEAALTFKEIVPLKMQKKATEEKSCQDFACYEKQRDTYPCGYLLNLHDEKNVFTKRNIYL